MATAGLASVQDAGPPAEADNQEELAENPGGPDDDSYAKSETLGHRAGYTRRANQASSANTLNQLEEDDRVKSPVIRLPQIDAGQQVWYDMKRRLNEESE
jgi:hypothetical protein